MASTKTLLLKRSLPFFQGQYYPSHDYCTRFLLFGVSLDQKSAQCYTEPYTCITPEHVSGMIHLVLNYVGQQGS